VLWVSHDATTQQVDAVAASALLRADKVTPENTKHSPAKSSEQDGRISWQLIYVLSAIVLGLLVLLEKPVGLI
jgi:hypothetical protein